MHLLDLEASLFQELGQRLLRVQKQMLIPEGELSESLAVELRQEKIPSMRYFDNQSATRRQHLLDLSQGGNGVMQVLEDVPECYDVEFPIWQRGGDVEVLLL